MKIKIDRKYKKDGYTIGVVYINGVYFCESLEDKDRGLAQHWTEAAVKVAKVAGRTAIPTGTYKVVLSYSPKFKKKAWAKKYGGLVPEIVNVKGFSGARLHPGSKAEDTEGCPLLGENKIKGGLINSQKKYYEFMDKYMMPAWTRKEEITLMIK